MRCLVPPEEQERRAGDASLLGHPRLVQQRFDAPCGRLGADCIVPAGIGLAANQELGVALAGRAHRLRVQVGQGGAIDHFS